MLLPGRNATSCLIALLHKYSHKNKHTVFPTDLPQCVERGGDKMNKLSSSPQSVQSVPDVTQSLCTLRSFNVVQTNISSQ